jgi:phosphoribosylformylglycinamidine synthase
MTQKYDGQVVYAPGTVIISAAGEIEDIRKIVEPVILNDPYTCLLYIDMSRDSFKTGGSSFAQIFNRLGTEAPTVKDPVYFAEVFDTIQELIIKGKIISGHDISAGGMITTLLEMCFSNTTGGISVDLTAIGEEDIIKLLFSQNPGIIIQVKDEDEATDFLLEHGISYFSIGHPILERTIIVSNNDDTYNFDINDLRQKWFFTSYLLDRRQCGPDLAKERFENYMKHELNLNIGSFEGSFKALGISPVRRKKSGIRAAIIREKGVNGDREMAYALYLAGFDVKDVHMTDLIAERETLEDISMIVFVGGFSNSDVLGSAKGWAGAFRFNEKARKTLDNFYKRTDTLSLGVCNGCQLMAELGLIYPEHSEMPKLLVNESHKFESGFLSVRVLKNNSVMLGNLEGMVLGIWVSNGEGQFRLPYQESDYNIPMKFCYHTYPANPNGSDFDIAGLSSFDGRHLAMMPHLERAYFPWQCGYYPSDRKGDEITPWMQAFVNARKWVEKQN